MKRGVSRKYNESSQDMHYQVIPEGIKLSPRIRIYIDWPPESPDNQYHLFK